jgi:hypothetical protein
MTWMFAMRPAISNFIHLLPVQALTASAERLR